MEKKDTENGNGRRAGIDLVGLLKGCPQGTAFYSPLYGTVRLNEVRPGADYPIRLMAGSGDGVRTVLELTAGGTYCKDFPQGECLVWPSAECRDWGRFQAELRWRAEKGGTYWFAGFLPSCLECVPEPCRDARKPIDDVRYRRGNYFRTEEDCGLFINDLACACAGPIAKAQEGYYETLNAARAYDV